MKTLALILVALAIAGTVGTKIVGHHRTCSVRDAGLEGTTVTCTTMTGLW